MTFVRKNTPEWERARFKRFFELWGVCPSWHEHRNPRNHKDGVSRKSCPSLSGVFEQLEAEIPTVGRLMATLLIDRWESRCGDCGQGADPNEKQHDTVLSYSGSSAGCHAIFTEVGSHYVGGGIEDAAQAMRPDLPWTDRKS